MTVFKVNVTLRNKDSFRTVQTVVSVAVDGDDPFTAQLVAMQLAAAHRDGFMPIDCRIKSAAL